MNKKIVIPENINILKIRRVGTKITQLLDRKISNPTEAYLTLKFLCIHIEETQQIQLTQTDEEKIRNIFKQEIQQYLTEQENNP